MENRLITHYGLFWSRANVFWGKQGSKKPGEMLGQTVGKGGENCDLKEYKGVYALYDGYNLVYVGQTGIGTSQNSLFYRIKEHHIGNKIYEWQKFSWFGFKISENKGFSREVAMKQLEAICIAVANPRFSKQSGQFGDAEQVMPIKSDYAKGDIYAQMVDIGGKIKEIKDMIGKGS